MLEFGIGVAVAAILLVALRLAFGIRWGPDRKYQLPPGWKLGWFAPEVRAHPSDPFAIRWLASERPGVLHRAPSAVGVWNTDDGSLTHLMSESEAADARWTGDGGHLVVAAAVESAGSGKEDIEVSVYAWPELTIVSEARLGLQTTGGDTWVRLATSERFGVVMRTFPGTCEELAVFTQPTVDLVARFEFEESLPIGLGAFSPDERYAAFLAMQWWSCEHESLATRSSGPVVWATLRLVDLKERCVTEHPILVSPPHAWRPGEELEEATMRIAKDPESLRFEDARTLVFELPWGGCGRVAVPPPREGLDAPAPGAVTAT